MPTIVTGRVLIVTPAANRDLVKATLLALDSTGESLLNSPLRQAGDSTNVIIAYWASWATDDLTRQAIMQAVRNAGWKPAPRAAEVKVYLPGDVVPSFGAQRIWLFEGTTWEPQDVLDELGLATPLVEA